MTNAQRIVVVVHQISQLGTNWLLRSFHSRTSCAKLVLSITESMARSTRPHMEPKGDSGWRRLRERDPWRPSTKRRTSPTDSVSVARANRYPPSAPRRDSTNPPCFSPERINSRNFWGICWRVAMSAIFTGPFKPFRARSKMASSAYSLFTEMFIESNIHTQLEIIGVGSEARQLQLGTNWKLYVLQSFGFVL